MAVKKAAPKKAGRVADPELAKEKKKGKPVVVFLPKSLHGRARLMAIALSTNLSTIIRGLLEEEVTKKRKAITDLINKGSIDSDVEDEEEDEVEEVEDSDDDDDEDADEDDD